MSISVLEPIAIVGRGCVLPGALTPQELWEAIKEGRDLFCSPPQGAVRVSKETIEKLARAYQKKISIFRGGFVRGFADAFDPGGFGVPPELLLSLDPLFQWSVHAGRQALLEAGLKAPLGQVGGKSLFVLANLGYPSLLFSSYAERVWLENQGGFLGGKAPSLLGLPDVEPKNRFSLGYAALLTAKALGLRDGFGLDAACASSLYAVKLGMEALWDRRADLVVVGGVNHADPIIVYTGFGILQALSLTGQSRPFDADADGMMPGEGAAAVVLKRLSDAIKDNDRILGVIRNVGLSNDGKAGGLLVPDQKGQERALRSAYEGTGIDPRSVRVLECHATGTIVGDIIELRSCHSVFGEGVRLGTIKSNLGHTITVAGLAGLLKLLSGLEHKTLPPNRPVANPLPTIGELGLRLIESPKPWDEPYPRRAGVNAFGFGGNNAHLILEEWDPKEEELSRSSLPVAPPRPSGAVAVVAMEAAVGGQDPHKDFVRRLLTGHEGPRRIEEVSLLFEGLRYPPRDLAQTLAQQLLMLEVARHAMERVGGYDPKKSGVFIGMGCDADIVRYVLFVRVEEWARILRSSGMEADEGWADRVRKALAVAPDTGMTVGTMPNIVANRIGLYFNFQGPGYVLEGEELSGIRALEIALRALRSKQLDLALAGAVDMCCETVHESAAKEVLVQDRHTPGDGAVVLALKRLEDAKKDGNPILAVFDDETLEDEPPTQRFGLSEGALSLTGRYGHIHAASGLLHVAGAVAALSRQAYIRQAGKPALPWLTPADKRSAQVDTLALGGARASLRVKQGDIGPHVPSYQRFASLHVYSGQDRKGVLEALKAGRESDRGPARLLIVAPDEDTKQKRIEAAKNALSLEGTPFRILKGVYFRERPIAGELALVFPGAAAAYPGMGRELLLTLPELTDALLKRFPGLSYAQEWTDPENEALMKDPAKVLLGSSFMCQVMAMFALDWLKLKPQAVLGVSSGESNSVVAMGAWDDLDTMVREIIASGMYSKQIAGEFEVAKKGWNDPGPINWRNYWVLAPLDDVKRALEGEERVYLAMINTDNDCMIEGDAKALEGVIERIGRRRAFPLGHDLVAHCELMRHWEKEWYAIHSRKTKPVPGVRFYSNASGTWYEASREAIAKALTGQAVAPVDFRRVVNAAFKDGVRVFVEVGPRGSCASWISDILGDREHLAVSLDRPRGGMEHAIEGIAQLLAAGVQLDYASMLERLAKENPPFKTGRMLTFPAHFPPVAFPDIKTQEPLASALKDAPSAVMEPAPDIPLAMDDKPVTPSSGPNRPKASPINETQPSTRPAPPSAQAVSAKGLPGRSPKVHTLADKVLRFNERVADAHRMFLEAQSKAMGLFIGLPAQDKRALGYAGPTGTEPKEAPEKRAQPADSLERSVSRPDAVHTPSSEPKPKAPSPGPNGGGLAVKAQTQPPSKIHELHEQQPKGVPAASKPLKAPTTPASSPRVSEPEWFQRISKQNLSSEERLALQGFRAIFGMTYKDAVPDVLPGPKWGRKELEVLACDKVSKVYGPEFAELDRYEPRVVRMPEPPLLLADAVLGIDAVPKSMSTKGKLWTETIVEEDAWYLHHGHVPGGISMEMGQADLMLISWLGVDFENKGERVYRLLGIDAIAFQGLLKIGDRLVVDINVGGYARMGPVRLFFFNSHGWVNGELASAVRNGQTGFFTAEELKMSGGVIWDPKTAHHSTEGPLDPPAVLNVASSFCAEKVRAFTEDRVIECFGDEFVETLNHTRTPRTQRGLMQLFDEVLQLDPKGGPWGRGYIKAVKRLTDEEWWYDGHFKGDPCMPGTLMIEGCAQVGAFYVSALGYNIGRDGWRFEPLLGELGHVRARGQAVPGARELIYEILVEEVDAGPIPRLVGQALITIDGLRSFHSGRGGGRLVPGYPMESRVRLLPKSQDERAALFEGRRLDRAHLLHVAWGKPSDAFGEPWEAFDGSREAPRLPGPPMLFVSRITKLEVSPFQKQPGGSLTAELDIPKDGWFFEENALRTMPVGFLLEAASQPCQWMMMAMGLADKDKEDAVFRLTEAELSVSNEVFPQDGLLWADVVNVGLDQKAGVAAFEATLKSQKGLLAKLKASYRLLCRPCGPGLDGAIGLKESWAKALLEPSGRLSRPLEDYAALPKGMLGMVEAVEGFWQDGGSKGLGMLLGSKPLPHGTWFFVCNALQDSHMPPSLMIEMAYQALGLLMEEKGALSPSLRLVPIGTRLSFRQVKDIRPGMGPLKVLIELIGLSKTDQGQEASANAAFFLGKECVATLGGFGLRVAKPDQETLGPDVVYDPKTELFLMDACPSWGPASLPPSILLDQMAKAVLKRAPGRCIVRIKNCSFRPDLWLTHDKPINQKVSVTPRSASVFSCAVFLQGEAGGLELASSADFELAEEFPLGPRALPEIKEGVFYQDPYAEGFLFQGPSWQVLRELRLGAEGASAKMNADMAASLNLALPSALIEACFQVVSRQDGEPFWSGVRADRAFHPVGIEEAEMFRPTYKITGEARLECRFEKETEDGQGFYVNATLIHDRRTFLKMRQVWRYREKGWADTLPRPLRGALINGGPVGGKAKLSSPLGKGLSLTLDGLNEADRPKGVMGLLYGITETDDPKRLLEAALKEAVSVKTKTNPRWVTIEKGPKGTYKASSDAVLGTIYPLSARLQGSACHIKHDGPAKQAMLSQGRALLREHCGEGWLGDDLFFGLFERFMGEGRLSSPKQTLALQGSPGLFLANHQIDMEGLFFCLAHTGITGVPTSVVVREEAKDTWLGKTLGLLAEHTGFTDPKLIRLIKQGDLQQMLEAFLTELEKAKHKGRALLVHVEGVHQTRAGQPVQKLSSALVDLAVRMELPIAPVRFSGSLPKEGVSSLPSFPVGYGKINVWIGRPWLPHELAPLNSKLRRDKVLASINGLGAPADPLEEEELSLGDTDFIEAIKRCMEEKRVSEVAAVLHTTLAMTKDPCEETLRVLAYCEGKKDALEGHKEASWLERFAKEALEIE